MAEVGKGEAAEADFGIGRALGAAVVAGAAAIVVVVDLAVAVAVVVIVVVAAAAAVLRHECVHARPILFEMARLTAAAAVVLMIACRLDRLPP